MGVQGFGIGPGKAAKDAQTSSGLGCGYVGTGGLRRCAVFADFPKVRILLRSRRRSFKQNLRDLLEGRLSV